MFQNQFFGAAIWINLETDAGSPLLIDKWPSDRGDEGSQLRLIASMICWI